MDVDGFWAVIGGARRRCSGDWTGVPAIVARTLSWLPAQEIADFAQLHDRFEHGAYREDLRAACFLINGGYDSDDLFLCFRNWLLVQGRAVYEAALADPDSLADVPAATAVTATGDDLADCEEFLNVAGRAWDRVTGTEEDGLWYELERRQYQVRRDRVPLPAGRPIKRTDRDRMLAVLPRLGALFYDRAIRRLGTDRTATSST
ncbi:DUF4240 domain-containing protein [Catellatospora coxensis]|uniref:DUF4240 domain-containing protein n=1 Tax=Catellatospora coxensis TaxID=310354 RepID=A0A8J3P6C8_9ACTN|nr:DUF4240 domain-containing protein [Catellatospora coxensis]GIG05372.1 hypothetical protein Cco03nite_20720 [Catellatospora coxensis]